MKLLWLLGFLLALVSVAFGQSCPTGFNRQDNLCVAKRPVKGECPKGSTFNLGKNLCVVK
ncbi:uncharacterized protein LOC131685096 [Topomyia yanbarensis]|uniref:uncharacterized protein LOC131685096 n=1 Tax=Topomyia yanbarensis TaxID=2498891 RepID=UPI00273AD37B|nr:uncharacterized protein LOC131685096 [Topomyia yanbarensis]